MTKAFDADGNEIEVYTPEEFQAGINTEVEKVKNEYIPKVTELEGKVTEVTNALNERTGEFKQFRKLSDEAVAKLGVAERTIYENGLVIQEEREKNKTAEAARIKAQVDSAIRAKAGSDEKLFSKMQELWPVIGVEATTPESIELKTKMILGAISTTQPDLVASVAGFGGGSFMPPVTHKEGESFADSDKGKGLMNEIGLVIPGAKK